MLVLKRNQEQSLLLTFGDFEKRIHVYEVSPNNYVRLWIDDVIHLMDLNDCITLKFAGHLVTIMITGFIQKAVSIGIRADKSIRIHRMEAYEKYKHANKH